MLRTTTTKKEIKTYFPYLSLASCKNALLTLLFRHISVTDRAQAHKHALYQVDVDFKHFAR